MAQKQRNKKKNLEKMEESTNKFGVLDGIDDTENGDMECFLTLDEIKLIKCKDRTVAQNKRYKHLMYKKKLSEETSTEKLSRKEKEKVDKANKRKNETSTELSERNERKRVATSNKRREETSDQRNERNQKKKCDTARKRENPPSLNEARNALNVLQGYQIVHELKNTDDSIGSMEVRCQSCSALKWKGETSSTCCNGGKIILESFPHPPEYLQKLWKDKTTEANLFRENSRSFNNGLALSSVVVSYLVVIVWELGKNISFTGAA